MRRFRKTRRFAEKQILGMDKLTRRAMATSDQDKRVRALKNIHRRIRSIEAQLKLLSEEERVALVSLQRRVDYMGDGFEDTFISRAIASHLLRNGRIGVGEDVARSTNVEHLVNADLWSKIHGIRTRILRGDVCAALVWCDDNASALRSTGSDLPFSLHLRLALELARSGNVNRAITYVRSKISPYANSACNHRIRLMQRTMASIVFCGESASSSSRDIGHRVYGDLYSTDRHKELADLFVNEATRIYGLGTRSTLIRKLTSGLCALKSPRCWCVDETLCGERREDCPTCDEHLGTVARSLPACRPARSRLICPVTKKIMNESNPPMALPNGHVYSAEAIEAMTTGTSVYCPASENHFPVSSARRVFIV